MDINKFYGFVHLESSSLAALYTPKFNFNEYKEEQISIPPSTAN